MVKIKFNKIRLDAVINNFLENIEDLEYSIMKYNAATIEDEMDIRLFSKAIRANSSSIFKLTEDYLGMALKKVGVGVSDMTFKSCVNLAYKNKLLPEDIKDYLINNVSIRNIDAHSYNQPSVEDLISMFNDNRELLYNYLEFLKDLSRNGFDREDSFKSSSLFDGL